MVGAVLACLCGWLVVCAPAWAAFSRPFVGEIKGTPTGPSGKEVPFDGVGGIAIDLAPPGNIWIGESGTKLVDAFGASNTFIEQLGGYFTASLAYDDLGGKLESAEPGPNEEPARVEAVAVDNSHELTAGDVYQVFHVEENGEAASRVRRVAANGEPAPFACATGIADGYIENGELVGSGIATGAGSHERWTGEHITSHPVRDIAVDSSDGPAASDIYVVNTRSHVPTETGRPDAETEIDQFTASGCFVRSIAAAGDPATPFGKDSPGIAVDPTSGDLIAADSERAVIDEFAPGGGYLGRLVGGASGTLFGQEQADVGGVAVSAAGDLYVREGDVVDEFGPGAFYPTVVTGEVSGNESGAVTLKGVLRGVANAEGDLLPVSGCKFEYVTQTSFEATGFAGASSTPCALDEGGSSVVGQRLAEIDHGVHGDVSGLMAGETYEYRLVAEAQPGEHGGVGVGVAESFASAGVPLVRNVSVGDVSSTFARLQGQVDPVGVEAGYVFEYEPAGEYEARILEGASDPFAGAASAPALAGSIEAGDGFVSVSGQASGLAPGTSYVVRLIASNAAGSAASGVVRLVSLPAEVNSLPDGRAYELVTPANKGDAEDLFGRVSPVTGEPENQDVGYPSEDGEHFLLRTGAAFGPFAGSGGNVYVFSRGATGWSFRAAASPALGVQVLGDALFEPSAFSTVAFADALSGPDGRQTVDLVGPSGGPYEPAAPNAAGEGASESEELTPVGGSRDLGVVIEESADHTHRLCSAGEEKLGKELDEGRKALYEWSAARGCLSLVDVQSGGGKLLSACGATLGLLSGGFEEAGGAYGAVSADGSKVFFTAPAPFDTSNGKASGKGCWNGGTSDPPELYARLDGETTVEISKPAAGVKPEGVYPAVYVGASADGTRVLFLTKTQLTADAASIKTHGLELYEYDTQAPEGERLKRISGGDLKSGPVEGRVLDVPAVAANGSAVYFNAEGNLAPGASEGGLYRYDTQSGQTSYIAPPQPYPNTTFLYRHPTVGKISATWYENETRRLTAGLSLEAPYDATANGQFLLYDAYRYDAQQETSVCVLCDPNTSTPIPDASINRSAVEEGNLAGGPVTAISENGQYVFFDTAESLVPRDTNGTLDVYEWHEGAISLISSGEDPSPSFFLGSSSYVNRAGKSVEGGNVFFGSHANLVPSIDTASEGNLYDARICETEDPCIPPPAGETAQCEGSTCQTPPVETVDATPTSLAFTGPSNPTQTAPGATSTKKTTPKPTKCKKPKKLGHGKCVERRTKPHKAKKADMSIRGKGGH